MENREKGCPVTVIEAKPNLGGRVWTHHYGAVPVELGAGYIRGRSQPLLQTIEEAACSCTGFPETLAQACPDLFTFLMKVNC